MKLQSVRIKTNDFPPEQKQLADTLGGILNPFIDKLVIGFNKNFTVDENLPFEFKTIDMQVNSSGIPLKNQVVSNSLENFKGYICVNVYNNDNSTSYVTSAPFLSTEISAEGIIIKHITGLVASTNYTLILLGIS
jgi:hypothetical protein